MEAKERETLRVNMVADRIGGDYCGFRGEINCGEIFALIGGCDRAARDSDEDAATCKFLPTRSLRFKIR